MIMGVQRLPPQPAQTEVSFYLSAPLTRPITINADTEIATDRTEVQEAIVKTLHTTEGMTEEEALDWEFPFGQAIFQTQDSKEGPRAFAEKRKPNFQRK